MHKNELQEFKTYKQFLSLQSLFTARWLNNVIKLIWIYWWWHQRRIAHGWAWGHCTVQIVCEFMRVCDGFQMCMLQRLLLDHCVYKGRACCHLSICADAVWMWAEMNLQLFLIAAALLWDPTWLRHLLQSSVSRFQSVSLLDELWWYEPTYQRRIDRFSEPILIMTLFLQSKESILSLEVRKT